jgi:hypothetical protein
VSPAEGFADEGSRSGASDQDLALPGGVALFPLARALAEALTPDDVAAAIFQHAIRSLGASTVGLLRLDEDGIIRFGGGAGHDEPGGPTPWETSPSNPTRLRRSRWRTGELISYGSAAERDARWPALAGLSRTSEAVVVLPLSARARGRQ